MGYAGTCSTLAMLEVPMTKNPLLQAENLLRANVWGRSRHWYQEMYQSQDVWNDMLAKLQYGAIEDTLHTYTRLACSVGYLLE